MSGQILKLDIAGTPHRWIDVDDAATYLAKDLVAWSLGERARVLRGGYNRGGVRSELEIPSIIAVKGRRVITADGVIPFDKTALLRRDRNTCVYCGQVFPERDLTVEHIVPTSRGGRTTFKNTAAACKSCNSRKGNLLLQEARMQLLYVPYVPNRYEGLILQNRRILVDQAEFLMAGVPRHSRLHA